MLFWYHPRIQSAHINAGAHTSLSQSQPRWPAYFQDTASADTPNVDANPGEEKTIVGQPRNRVDASNG